MLEYLFRSGGGAFKGLFREESRGSIPRPVSAVRGQVQEICEAGRRRHGDI